jgi:hypothetical protein
MSGRPPATPRRRTCERSLPKSLPFPLLFVFPCGSELSQKRMHLKALHLCRAAVAICLSFTLFQLGCSGPSEPGKYSAQVPSSFRCEGVSTETVSFLIVAHNSGGDLYIPDQTIRDPEFSSSLLQDLRDQTHTNATIYTWVQGRMLIFTDNNLIPVAAYKYWPAGSPPHIFSPRSVKVDGEGFRDAGSFNKLVSIAEFDKRIAPFLDVWEKNARAASQHPRKE